MDLTLLHPKLVHVPMALAVLMPLVMTGVLVMWRRGLVPRAAWGLAVALQAILVLSAAASLKTGEIDEDHVEDRVPKAALDRHEDAAEVFVWAGAAVLALAAAALFTRTAGASQAIALAATVGTVVVFGLGYRVGEAGGALVYQHGAACPDVAGVGPAH